MNDVIKYTSSNGFTGILFGEKSLSIKDKNGKEVLHTGFRTINTYEALVDCVETFPEFYEMLKKNAKVISDDFKNSPEEDTF